MSTRRPLLQNARDWRVLATPGPARPAVVDGGDDGAQMNTILEYNASLAFTTRDTKGVADAIDRAKQYNSVRSLGGARAVLVTGRPMDGKTQAVTMYALQDSRQLWQAREAQRSPDDPHPKDLHAPWIYIEVEAGRDVAGIARSIMHFLGAPVGPRETADVLLHRLRELLPKIGAVGLILDDAHGIVGASNTESRRFAGALKALITGLPVTIVIIGVRLNDTALAGARGDEVRLRCELITCGDWPPPSKQNKGGFWKRLLFNMQKYLWVPDGAQQMTGDQFVFAVANGSDFRPGLAITWVKNAADYAVRRGEPVNLEALRAVAGISHADIPTKTVRKRPAPS